MVQRDSTLPHLLVWNCSRYAAMKALSELRNKHWSGRNTLWPRNNTVCRDVKAVMVANDEISDARMYIRNGDFTTAMKHWHRAQLFAMVEDK